MHFPLLTARIAVLFSVYMLAPQRTPAQLPRAAPIAVRMRASAL